MWGLTKIAVLEATGKPSADEDLSRFARARVLMRWRGQPVGWIDVPIVNGRIDRAALGRGAVDRVFDRVLHEVLANALLSSQAGAPIDTLLRLPRAETPGPKPTVTVAICTRDRVDDMRRCLAHVAALDPAPDEVVVVDNASTTDGLERLVEELNAAGRGPAIRHVREHRPGLDWARNRAVIEARSEIIAFTDDDTAVEPDWIGAIRDAFAEEPDLAAMTGLVIPYEIETEAQAMFEFNTGFDRGVKRRRHHFPGGHGLRWQDFGTGELGAGANMAFRRSVFADVGPFDPALDVGTPSNGGGDVEMFLRVIAKGFPFAYEPRALIRHRHRRNREQLKRQIRDNGSFYIVMQKAWRDYPLNRWQILRISAYWAVFGITRRMIAGLLYPRRISPDIHVGELIASFRAPRLWKASRARAEEVQREHGPQEAFDIAPAPARATPGAAPDVIGVHLVDLSAFHAPETLSHHARNRVFFLHRGRAVGHVDLSNGYAPVSARRLADAAVSALTPRLLALSERMAGDPDREKAGKAAARTAFARFLAEDGAAGTAPEDAAEAELDPAVPVSVVVIAGGRPDQLSETLRSVTAQETGRAVEVVVVDTDPASGRSASVAAGFPGVSVVEEPRDNLAHARNTGFAAATGEIVVMVQEDVIAPPGWLEHLMAPFARQDVACVTGNTLPAAMETAEQIAFERFRVEKLGRRYQRREADRDKLEETPLRAVRTWEFGPTAHFAVRAAVPREPDIGPMESELAPAASSGTGGGEDYFIYKIITAGGTVLYEPTAWLRHDHRPTRAQLRRDIRDHGRSFIAGQVATLARHRDLRALRLLVIGLPAYHLRLVFLRLIGRRSYPLDLSWQEFLGNLSGYAALVRPRGGRADPIPPRAGPGTGAEAFPPRLARVMTPADDR
ncbi:glycosyltransferase [Rhodobacterales bacterium HKCCE2091]|nr:glycosyltransferase [Rhodobacterales bacterium HKCCE2091]